MHGETSQKDKMMAFLAGMLVGLIVLGVVLFQLPAVQDRISWRIDFAKAYIRGLIDPVEAMPTADLNVSVVEGPGTSELAVLPEKTSTVTATPTQTAKPEGTEPPTPTVTLTATATLPPTPIPEKIQLTPPKFEKQEVNNCGPATLALHLRYYGWDGDQTTISSVIKPLREDRNVNVEELAYYVHTQAAHFDFQYRVGGNIDILKRLLAAGFPVTVEEGFVMAESYWYNDDRWAGHYLLLTGYDDATQRFTAHDVFVGPNISIPYEVLDKNWKAFNRVYIVLYPPEQRETVKSILGDHWDVVYNREHAIAEAEKEIEDDSTDSYAWFNLGTNLVYFERYSQAAQAYDNAREHGLPQRMLRYQFGPFFAYFHTGRLDDLLALTEYALKITPNSEEAMLWRGWAMYREGKREESVKLFNDALAARPDYTDAQYGLNFVLSN